MLRFENVATPFTAGTLSVPASVPPAWFAPIATVMVPVKLVTVFPDASRALTATAGVIVAPASAFVGWTLKPKCVAGGGGGGGAVMSNGSLVAPVRPGVVARKVSPLLALSMLRSENVATPFTASTIFLPARLAPPGLASSAIVTGPVKAGTRFPASSRAATFTAGVMAEPACVVCGCRANPRCVAAGGGGRGAVMSNGSLVAPVAPEVVARSVYPLPALSTLKSANVATPFTAFTCAVPNKAASLGFASRPTVTGPLNVVAG